MLDVYASDGYPSRFINGAETRAEDNLSYF